MLMHDFFCCLFATFFVDAYSRLFFLLMRDFFVQMGTQKIAYAQLFAYSRILGKIAYSRSFYKGFIKKWVGAFGILLKPDFLLKPDLA